MKNILFTKYSNDRCKDYKIKTIIYEENGSRKVQKIAMSPEGKQHLMRLSDLYTKLNGQFENSFFEANRVEDIDDGVELEYVEGTNLADILEGFLIKKDMLGFSKYLDKYKEEVLKLADSDFAVTTKYLRVFGQQADCEFNQKSMNITDIDLIFDNIILSGTRWLILDYEWTFEFPIPVAFVLYRTAHYFSIKYRNILNGTDIYAVFGISDDKRMIYHEMEHEFQKFVYQNNKPLWELYSIMGKNIFFPVGLVEERKRKEKLTHPRVITADKSGQTTIVDNITTITNEKEAICFEINVAADSETVIVLPALQMCNIYIMNVIGKTSNGEYDIQYGTNGCSYDNRYICFATREPQIWIGDLREGITSIYIEYIIDYQNEYLQEQMRKGIDKYNSLNEEICKQIDENNLVNEEMRKQVNENNLIKEEMCKQATEINLVKEENLRMKTVLKDIYNSKSWKLTKPLRYLGLRVHKKGEQDETGER